jgi:hypothetical protein
MPQKITPWWEEHLGSSFEEAHEVQLHTLGNLTLTGWNTELSNAPFPEKQKIYQNSPLWLNKSVAVADRWDASAIEVRGRMLAEQALEVWPDIRPSGSRRSAEATGATPVALYVLGERFEVNTWQEVLKTTLEQVGELGDDVFAEIAASFGMITSTPNRLRRPKPLPNGYFYEAHLSAESIHKLCQQVSQSVGLKSSEWRVEMLD